MNGKRIFDIIFSVFGLLLTGWLIVILVLVSRIDTSGTGIFKQKRVGKYGKLFTIYKIRTMHAKTLEISTIGRMLRKFKFDELPQLFNILKGDMSFVGPRPDIPGYYDTLIGEDRIVLNLKPGLISRAAIKYYNEEALLAAQEDPLTFNDTILFPDKVKMNIDYYKKQGIKEDISIIFLFIKKIFKF